MLPFMLGVKRVRNSHTDICTRFIVVSNVRSFGITQKLIKVNIKQPKTKRLTTESSRNLIIRQLYPVVRQKQTSDFRKRQSQRGTVVVSMWERVGPRQGTIMNTILA